MDNLPLQQFYNYCHFLQEMVAENQRQMDRINSK